MKRHIATFLIALFGAAAGVAIYFYIVSFRAKRTVVQSTEMSELQADTAVSIEPFPSFFLRKGQVDPDGEPISNAQLCLKQKDECFTLKTEPATGFDYYFGLNPRAERVPVGDSGSLIFFSGTFYGGGSGMLDELALLRFQTPGKITNLLPDIQLTDESDRRFWSLPEISNMPTLVVADADWPNEDEPHFGPHFYYVSAFVFDKGAQKYTERVQYLTSRKYSDYDVLVPERATIESELGITTPR